MAVKKNEIPDATIVDRCPVCGKEYKWDACQDVYEGAVITEVADVVAEDETIRSLRLFTCCGCGGTIGISVIDEYFGSELYTTSPKEL